MVAWLRAQLDEDERLATGADPRGAGWSAPRDELLVGAYVAIPSHIVTGQLGSWSLAHIDRHDPARVLAEVAAKRLLIEAIQNLTPRFVDSSAGNQRFPLVWEMDGSQPGTWKQRVHEDQRPALLRLLALPYAGQPGWREEWRA
jgi:hypothetical protein